MSRRHQVFRIAVAVAAAIGILAMALNDSRQVPDVEARGEPVPAQDMVPGQAQIGSSIRPANEVVRIPGEVDDPAKVDTPVETLLSRLPSDASIETLKGVLSTEIHSFGEELRLAEAKAGESEATYVEFLQAELRLRMRQEARQSLDRRNVVLIPAASKKAAFARPYISYTTSETLGGKTALICVPILELESLIPELKKTVDDTTGALVQSFVTTHNVKRDAERRAVRTAFDAGRGLPGIPPSLEPWIAYRLRFVEGDFIEVSR